WRIMDVLLFNPYYSQPIRYYNYYRPTCPYNLLYLAAYLKKFGIPCKIYELGVFDPNDAIVNERRVRFGLSDEKIAQILASEKPRIVGITSMYSIHYRDVVEIADTVKKTDPNIVVVVGGNHPSSYWQYVARNRNIDYVAIGEGEVTFLQLCQRLLDGKTAHDVPGLAHKSRDGQVVRTPPRELIPNLDDIPIPDFSMVDFRRYLGEGNPFSIRPPAAGIISSRGCPMNCVYCTIKAVWGRTWRGRSPANVVDELELVHRTYGVREFGFLDDSMGVDRKRLAGICDEIIRRGLDIKWSTPNGIAHWMLNEELLDKMKASGCYRITFGIESGNPETRKFLGKPFPLDQAKRLIQYANRIGMWTNCTNILGFPYEPLESIQDTIRFAKTCGTDFACFYLLMPQPTSDVYQYFKKEGLLNFDSFFEKEQFDEEQFEQMNYVLNETGADTTVFTREELNRLQKKAYRSFLLYRTMTFLVNPMRLLRKIRSREDFFYVLRLARLGIRVFFRTLNPHHQKSSDYLYAKTTPRIRAAVPA
ncbi:MAG: B12-binding domain-containing radical SAM protein, partial [Verrucomicrobiae bacterium]|nr:B12-binding domain-containing radical SAM protein [Verrucomicrobiae bacterium]